MLGQGALAARIGNTGEILAPTRHNTPVFTLLVVRLPWAAPPPGISECVIHSALVHIHTLLFWDLAQDLQELGALYGSAGPQTLCIEPALFLRVQPIFFIAAKVV
ncbi:hypothetical protein IAD21_00163 [Abditibacteriota bacterium]|nr:hypothetical protein IAD21_00163 [Abditibacteriota bacterium]